jgi:integrase/recombinase XerD
VTLGSTALLNARLLEDLSELYHQLRYTPMGPRHLLVLFMCGMVVLMSSRYPHLYHGPATNGLPLPDLLVAGLTGPAVWQRYELAISMDGRHTDNTVKAYRKRWRDWLGFLHDQGCKRARCDRGEGCTGIPWHRATEKHLKRFLDQPARSGRRKGQPKAVRTRALYVVVITGVYRYATRKRLITRDPMVDVRPPMIGDGLPRSFSRDQLRRIFAAASVHQDRRIYLFTWLGYHGLRVGEMAALDLEHVRLDDDPQILVRGKGPGEGKWRPVPLQSPFVPVLRAWIDGQPGRGPVLEKHNNRGEPTGEPLTSGAISTLMSAFIQQDCGIDGSAHRLRHTAATFMLDEGDGENLYHVQRFLGHARPDTTLGYVKAHAWNVRKWVNRMPDPRDPYQRPAGREPAQLGEALRRVLTPEMSRRLRELPEELASTYRPLLALAGLLDADGEVMAHPTI